MINWRYHVMSIAAVFLALGIGITVGISLGEDGTVDLGQEGLADAIRSDLDELRARNDTLATERSIDLRYQDDTFPYLVAGKLQGKEIAIVSAAAVSEETRRSIASSIQTAGGQVVSTTVLRNDFDAGEVVERAGGSLQQYPQLAIIEESTIDSILGAQLALEVAAANPAVALSALDGVLVDSVQGDYERQVGGVLILTRGDDSYSPQYTDLERELILSLKSQGFITVGGEPADAPRSEVPMFIAMGISSVDNIESRIGQLSLIYALNGERDAFGVKPTADLLIPILRIPIPGEEDTAEATTSTISEDAALAE